MAQLREQSEVKRHLLNRMLIFSVKNRSTKEKYVPIFKLIIAEGENWNRTDNSVGMHDEELDHDFHLNSDSMSRNKY